MKSAYWYGYLEAGVKSSLVARDPNLDTGNKETVYLFNFNRDEIKEYRLDIVQAKLRELTTKEAEEIKNLEKKFKAALGNFKSRASILASIPEKAKSAPPKQKVEVYEDSFSSDIDIIEGGDDEDNWDDEK